MAGFFQPLAQKSSLGILAYSRCLTHESATFRDFLYNQGVIATLAGKVKELGIDWAIVEVGGVGYEIFAVPADVATLAVGQAADFVIYEHIREDQYTLYGFAKRESKIFFTQLLSISGIGPKVALAVISSSSLDRLQQAVMAGDPQVLRGVAGVGTKTAERIIVELRGKLGQPSPGAAVTNETYQALVGLGYSSAQAAAAVADLPAEVTDSAERIKLALRGLAK